MSVTRDETYYYEHEGDCVVVQVQNVLFRIHKFVLKRESSMFSDMFLLPQSPGFDSDGLNDDKPITLPDLEAETFRALCWVLYASPLDLRRKTVPGHADVNQLISVAGAAHRFGFESTQKWALEILEELFKYPTDSFVTACSDDTFTRLCRLYILVDHDEMLSRTFKSWATAIDHSSRGRNGELKVTERELAAVEFADGYTRHRLVRSFLAGLYYTLSVRMNEHWPGGQLSSFEDIALGLGLAPKHATRLLVGHFNLTNYWIYLRSHPPTLDRIVRGCTPQNHEEQCCPKWESIWGDLSQPWAEPLNLNPVQPMANLNSIKAQIGVFRYAPDELPFCASKIPDAIVAQLARLRDVLPDCYLGASSIG